MKDTRVEHRETGAGSPRVVGPARRCPAVAAALVVAFRPQYTYVVNASFI